LCGGDRETLFLQGVVEKFLEFFPGQRAGAVLVVLEEDIVESLFEFVGSDIHLVFFTVIGMTCAAAHLYLLILLNIARIITKIAR
jgi:hypothetical protein